MLLTDYYYDGKIKKNEKFEARGTYGGERERAWVGKPEERTPLGRPRGMCEDTIKMNLKISRMTGLGLNSSGSVFGYVAGCSEHGDDISCFIKFGEFLD